MFWRMSFLFLLILGCQISTKAQGVAPPELAHIRLSGLSGSSDHRLAVINGKTFSPGEANNIKVAGKTIAVKCLEIRESFVIVQIGDLTTHYRLTMSGEIAVLAENPLAAPPVKPVIATSSPAPAWTSAVKLNVLRPATIQPSHRVDFRYHFLTPIILTGEAVLFLLCGIALGIRVGKHLYRKNEGEALVAETIDRHFKQIHLLVNNLTLPANGGTTQIDHVIVASTGVFVIETKHYFGWIFGNPQDNQWAQQIYLKKFRFQNPLRQNYAHIKVLQALFDLPEDHFHSVVVFTGDAQFKTDLGPNVLKIAGLIPFLTAERPALFDERQMAQIVGWIEMKRNRRSVETDEYHINHIRRKVADKIPPPPKPKASPF